MTTTHFHVISSPHVVQETQATLNHIANTLTLEEEQQRFRAIFDEKFGKTLNNSEYPYTQSDVDQILYNFVIELLRQKEFNMVKTCLREGIDLTQLSYSYKKNKVNFSLLTVAILYYDFETFKMILDQGVNPNAINDEHSTVLHFAANMPKTEGLEACQLLLQYGADPSMQNKDGYTPAMIAAQHINTPLIERLIPSKDVALIRNHESQNALDLMCLALRFDSLHLFTPTDINQSASFLISKGINPHEVPNTSFNRQKMISCEAFFYKGYLLTDKTKSPIDKVKKTHPQLAHFMQNIHLSFKEKEILSEDTASETSSAPSGARGHKPQL